MKFVLQLCGCAVLGVAGWTLSEAWYYLYLLGDNTFKVTSLSSLSSVFF